MKSIPVTKETAGASLTASLGIAQLAQIAPQINDAMNKAQDNISSGDWVRIGFGVATIVIAGFIAWSQVRKYQKGTI